ncbi:MAG: hypothetical protein ACHQM4_08610 [Thermoanaerobaculia bacterium]
MHHARWRTLALCLALGSFATPRAAATEPPSRPVYPTAPRASQVDDYHGTLVSDPFRPLEDPDAPATRAWIEAENSVTRGFLDAVPERSSIRDRLAKLWNYERFTTPVKEGGRLFYSRNDGLQNQAVLYVLDREGAAPRVLLDPNGLSKDGTVAVAGLSVSRDGKSVAYAVASGGSDWQEWHVLDDFESRWSWVASEGTTAYLRTDRSAQRGRLVSVDLAAAAPVLRDVIPQGEAVIQSVHAVGGRFVVVTMRDGSERVRIHGHDGTPGKEVTLPALGAVSAFAGRPTDRETFFSFTSFTYPSTVFRLDPATATATVFRKPGVDFDPAAYDTKQVFFPALDGTPVPMFLVARKGTKWDGANPTMLHNINKGTAYPPVLVAFLAKTIGGLAR